MRWILCAVVWILCLGAALYAAAETKLGRILYQFSPNHGIHLGDVMAFVLGISVAALVTLVAWLTRPSSPSRSGRTEPRNGPAQADRRGAGVG